MLNARDALTEQRKREARNARWRWISNVIKRHTSSRRSQMREWAIDGATYRSEDPTTSSSQFQYAHFDDDLTEDPEFEANYLYAFVDQLAATVCPPNPEVTVRARRSAFKNASVFRGLLVNEILRKERMAIKLWKAVGRACIFPRTFLKTTWSRKDKRPHIRVINPHFVYYDEAATEWEDVRYVCEVRLLTRGEFMRRVKKNKRSKKGIYLIDDKALEQVSFGPHPEWVQHLDDSGMYKQGRGDDPKMAYNWAVVYEFYDLVSETMYHFADGLDQPVFESELPYQLLKNPFHKIVFNDNLKGDGGLADARIVRPTLDRLSHYSRLRMDHLESSIPIPVVNEGLVDDVDNLASQFRNASGPRDLIRLSTRPNININDVLGHTPVAQLPIEWEATIQQLVGFVEMILGLPGFARGMVGETDVATEAAIADGSVKQRNAKRQKVVYGAIQWVAEAIIRLFIQFMPEDSTIPLQLMEEGPEVAAGRQLLGFGGIDPEGGVEDDDPWDYSFEALAHNGDEDNRVVRLKTLMTLLEAIAGNPAINNRRLMQAILEAAKLDKVLNTAEEEQQAQAAMTPPAQQDGTAPTPDMPMTSAEATMPHLSGGQMEGGPLPAQEMGAPLA